MQTGLRLTGTCKKNIVGMARGEMKCKLICLCLTMGHRALSAMQ